MIELTLSSPPQSFSEPLTLGEIKKYLELPARSPVDTAEDAMLEGFIIAAREVAEILQGRDLIEKQYDLHLDYFPCEPLTLRKPLSSVDLFRYRDSDGNYTTLVENTGYLVDLPRALVTPIYGERWPSFTAWPSSAVMVRFRSGYPSDHPFWSDAGQRILIGMKLLISHWFNGRLPFEPGNAVQEYPYSVTALLSFGAVASVR